MDTLLLALLCTSVGVVSGYALCRRNLNSVMTATVAAAEFRASAEANSALALANERVRTLEEDRTLTTRATEEVRAEVRSFREQLEIAREEHSRLSERASRVPDLETQVRSLGETLEACRKDLQEAGTAAAERAQLLRMGEERIQDLERRLHQAELATRTSEEQAGDLRENSGRLNAELQAERDLVKTLRTDCEATSRRLQTAQNEANTASRELAETQIRLTSEKEQSQEKLAMLLEAKEALANQFRTLANEILEEKSKRFSEQNQASLGQLLDPLKVKLGEFQTKVEDVYVKEGKDRMALAEQVRQLMELNRTLSTDAKNLTSALKGSNKTQGNWGELVLERVLEASGLRKGEEYDVQESHTTEDGSRLQPDVVIHLPEDRHLVIDAKISLTAYEDCVSAETEPVRLAAAKRHLDSIRVHMKSLSSRNYQDLHGLKSLDFVIMFIPIEPAFMLAVTNDQNLFMDAWQKNVLLVSPSTLLFVVRTVAHLWRQEAQSRNAQDIAKRGAELYDKLVGFVDDLQSLGKRLKQAQDDYTGAFSKLTTGRGNVIRQAEMLKELGVKPAKSLSSQLIEISNEEPAALLAPNR